MSSNATSATLIRRVGYGGRKGRRALRRLTAGRWDFHTYTDAELRIGGKVIDFDGIMTCARDLGPTLAKLPPLDAFKFEIGPIQLEHRHCQIKEHVRKQRTARETGS